MKRIFDFVVSFLALLILSPIIIMVSILVLFRLGWPVFFTQIRPGLQGKPFRMIKFRTMTNEKDRNGKLLPNEARMTEFGRFLRSTSLDEIPELINVLKGDMSLVGPRPLLMEYLPYFSEKENRRHQVRPGITGWSQVNGRNAIGWDEKLKLDIWYVDKRSLWLDVKILFMTVFSVLKRDGINHDGQTSMPRFDDFVKQNR